jgi:hypothetical protein
MSCIIKSPNQRSLITKFKSLSLILSQNHLSNERFITSRSIGGFLRLIEPPQKRGVRLLKIDQGILDEARMCKHTYEAYKEKIKVEIMLLQICLRITR